MRALHDFILLQGTLTPLFGWKDDQIKGLTRLLTLALRLLTVIETQVRRALEQTQQTLAGLYQGQPSRTTARPTGKRILQAFARARLTLTQVERGTATYWHLTPLSALHEQLLRYLHLPFPSIQRWPTIRHKPRGFTRKWSTIGILFEMERENTRIRPSTSLRAACPEPVEGLRANGSPS